MLIEPDDIEIESVLMQIKKSKILAKKEIVKIKEMSNEIKMRLKQSFENMEKKIDDELKKAKFNNKKVIQKKDKKNKFGKKFKREKK